jgi:hypothetical protein
MLGADMVGSTVGEERWPVVRTERREEAAGRCRSLLMPHRFPPVLGFLFVGRICGYPPRTRQHWDPAGL